MLYVVCCMLYVVCCMWCDMGWHGMVVGWLYVCILYVVVCGGGGGGGGVVWWWWWYVCIVCLYCMLYVFCMWCVTKKLFIISLLSPQNDEQQGEGVRPLQA